MSLWRGGIAFDRMASSRSFDLDGRLRIELAVISQANVCKYRGFEIPDAQSLGLDTSKTYSLYRDPIELGKATDSTNGLPVLLRHAYVDATDHQPDLVVGSTLSDARFEAPHLLCSLAIWSNDAIEGIETGSRGALSAGYRYKADMKSGISPDGEAYEGVMRDLIFNHVALVDRGRIGPAAIVADRLPDWRIEENVFADFRRRYCA